MEKWRVAKHEFPGYGDPKLCPFAIMEDGEFGLQIATVMGDAGLNAEAHANRIAAAPEMYEALSEFPMLLAPATTAREKRVQEWQNKALAALAKADGKAGV